MKQLILQRPGLFELTEGPRPAPGPGQALIQVRRVGLCGSDIHAFQGNQPFFTYPRILGHEMAGEVAELGPGVTGLEPGDRVAVLPYLTCGQCLACLSGRTNCCVHLNLAGVHSDGGLREWLALPAANLLQVQDLDWDSLALVECLAIGAHAVARSGLAPGENVLVIGAGPIGLGVMEFATLSGARLLVTDLNPDRLAFCRRHFPQATVLEPEADAASEAARLTDGEYPTLIFEATGSAASMGGAVRRLAHTGRLVLVSLVKGDVCVDDVEFHKREATILSSRNATKRDFQRVLGAMASGQVKAAKYVTHRCRLEELPDLFPTWIKPESRMIKGVVEV